MKTFPIPLDLFRNFTLLLSRMELRARHCSMSLIVSKTRLAVEKFKSILVSLLSFHRLDGEVALKNFESRI